MERVKNSEFRGIFISYIEISKYLKDKDTVSSQKNIDVMIENIKKMNLNTIILHVRPAMDAIYPSSLFPVSKYLTDSNEYSYDVLSYFLEKAHENDLKLIAWINPYRVCTTSDISCVSSSSPAYSYLGSRVIYVHNGIYLNPARKESIDIILDGIREVLEYDVDGILFDDYFYPSSDVDFVEYQEFIQNNLEISLEDFHRENVNKMVMRVHQLCQEKGVPFGISPEGNMENNYSKNYADVGLWLNSYEYVDYIMPQIYYGFYNTNACSPYSKRVI